MGYQRQDRERLGKWLRLHLTSGLGAKTFTRLRESLGSVEEIIGASAGKLASVPGIGTKKAEKIANSRDQVDVESELDLAEKLGVTILTFECEAYPKLLKQIHDPPQVLYVKGELTRADQLAVAVVGSRNCSQYGQEQASRLSHMLAAAGVTIVSGLARGIDTAAHRGAIAADGRTIAVQGCGLEKIYPPENADLAERIAQSGAVISEFPLRYEPLPTTFPMRNRIIAGLSLGTLLVEARARSGALITTRLATEQNREVMAVPGRVDSPGSFGPHQLIKDGAKLVENVEDILDTLGVVGGIIKEHATAVSTAEEKEHEPDLFDVSRIRLTKEEAAVLASLDHHPLHIDEIISSSRLSAGQVNAAVVSLQLKSVIKQLPGSYYVKR
jgi:DNA processing protein